MGLLTHSEKHNDISNAECAHVDYGSNDLLQQSWSKLQIDSLRTAARARTSTLILIWSFGCHICAGDLRPRGGLLPELPQYKGIILFASPPEKLKQHYHKDDSNAGDCERPFAPDVPLA
jgi:hypothetical protein